MIGYIEIVIFNELQYFLDNPNHADALLKELQVDCVQSDQKRGFWLRWNKYGRVLEKELGADSSKESLLVFKPFSSEQKGELQKHFQSNPMLEIFILSHRMLSLKNLFDDLKSLGVPIKNIYFLTSAELQSGFVFQNAELEDFGSEFSGVQKIPIKLKSFSLIPKRKKQKSSLPFAVATFIKILLSPFLEIKRAYQMLQVSQFVWAKRLSEMGAFFIYLAKSCELIFYGLRYVYGLSQRITIPVYFKTRHVILMSRFKSYGFLVDSYFWVQKNIFILAKDSLKIFGIRTFFIVRHFFLMVLFKMYGFIFDLIIFTFYFMQREGHRFYVFFRYTVMRIVLYPIFKIYWFSEFQYRKRIKKILWTE